MNHALKRSVEDALLAYSPLRTSKAEITVMADSDGAVTLTGHAPSGTIKRMAALLAGSVDGVGQVVNHIVADPDLERSVAQALAADSRTHAWPIRVRAEVGYVQLQGSVPDEEAVQTALEVASQVEGVRQVVSALKVGQAERLAA